MPQTYQRGLIIDVPGLGERVVRKARNRGPCSGWTHKGGHVQIEAGDLYWESEIDPYAAGGFAMRRCCMDCLPTKQQRSFGL